MSQNIHTVLGAAGGIGKAVIHELQARKATIRAVGRSVAMSGVENFKADVLNKEEAMQAIQGSTYVYLCIGLPYSAKNWAKNWPIVMQNVIDACVATDAKLIFLDNIYMYGPAPLAVPFAEDHPQRPDSKKGEVRKQIADMLMQAIHNKQIKGLIGRAADIYGPHANNSILHISYLERMLKGKAPQTIIQSGVQHTFVNTTDIGKALVLLALEENAYGQVWHLPVGPPITIEEMTELFNQELGTSFKLSYLPPIMVKLLGLFMPPLKEIGEMMYQFTAPYIMSYEKFQNQFPDFQVSTYKEGIKAMIESFK